MDILDDDSVRNQLLLAIQKAIISSSFSEGDWREIGYKTNTIDFLVNHSRLFRSLKWGDDDYSACVFQALEYLLQLNSDNIMTITENYHINKWLIENEPLLLQLISSKSSLAPAFTPPKLTSKEVVEMALNDVTVLGAISATDRIHTALHGYFESQCDSANIIYKKDATITELYKALRTHHPKLQDKTIWAADIEKILKAFASVLDTLNNLRNHASLAHPNDDLLEQSEAELLINASRTILHYLDTRLS